MDHSVSYNFYFEVASVCILMMMIIMMNLKQQLDIFKNKLFRISLLVLLLLNLVDIGSSILVNRANMGMGDKIPLWLNYGAAMASAILQQVEVVLLLWYVMVAANLRKDQKRVLPVFVLISVVFDGLVLSTPVTKLLFYFDADGRYQQGRLQCIIYVLPLVLGAYVCISLFRHRKQLLRIEKNIFTFFCVSTIVATLIQVILMPHHLIAYFWVSIALITIFLTVQSPDYYLDRSTYAFNHEGLMVILNDRIDRKIPFSMLMMAVHDFEDIQGGFSAQNKKKVYGAICSSMLYRSKKDRKRYKTDVFRDDDKIYIMFHDPKQAEALSGEIGSWVIDGIYVDEQAPKVKLVARMLLFDFPGRIQTEEEFHSVIKYFLMDDYYKRDNVIQFINEEFYRKKKRYDDVRHLVEEAIRTDGIEVYYQPIYDTRHQEFHSSEALVRLRDVDSIGFVSPEEFIPIAEKEHLILQLEDLILRKICEFIRRVDLPSYGVKYVEVNLSGNQCMQRDLADQLLNMVEEYGIALQFINFEVTETAAIEENEYLLRNMRNLQRGGSTFSLDDYGSGSSNLKYLVDYPFEIVKLDKSIVWAHFGASDSKTRAILPYTVRMLREMNVTIVAEGIETVEQKEELERLGVQYLQGFYFSKPIPENQYLEFLKQHMNQQ